MEHKQTCETILILVAIIMGIAAYQMIIPLLIGGFMLYVATWPFRTAIQVSRALKKYNSQNQS